MNSALQDFLAGQLPFPGLAAWSVRLADRSVASQSYAPWLPSAQAEQVLARIALAADGFRQHRLEASRLCWVFEHLRLYLARREDGACLALIVQNSHDLSVASLDSALEGFSNLTMGAES